MEHIIRGLSLLLVPLFTSVVINAVLSLLRQPKKAKKGKVHFPKLFAIIGAITAVFFGVFTFFTAFSDEPTWISFSFLSFSLLGTGFIIAFMNCRISYDENGFSAKNFFGIKRKFTYDQLTAIQENPHETYIYLGRHRVMIDEYSVGGPDFIAFVKKEYRKLHDGQALPRNYKTTHDIFHGNIENVTGFMVAYIMISALILAFTGLIVWYIFFAPSTADNTVEQQLTFQSYVTDDKDIILTSSDDEIYQIRFAEESFDIEKIIAICDGKTVVTTYSKEITPDNRDKYYSVKALLHHDIYLLHFDDTNRLHRQESWPLIFFPVILGALWGAYLAGAIIVGRNPKKFSKKVVRLFFKNGYVKK